jgi:hypothetical protein
MGHEEDDGVAGAAHAGSAAHAMHHRVGILWRVQLQDPLHIRNVQPTSSHIRAQQTTWKGKDTEYDVLGIRMPSKYAYS